MREPGEPGGEVRDGEGDRPDPQHEVAALLRACCTMVAIRSASAIWTGTTTRVRRKVFRTAAVKFRSPAMRR